MSNKQSHYLQLDFIVLFILFAGVSLLAIYNAQQLEQYGGKNFVVLQIFWFVAGISIVAFLQLFDLEQLYKVSIFAYLFGVLLLAVLLVSPESIARTINNAKSWFTLPGFSMQPSEFAKISTILYTSAVISKHKIKYEKTTWKTDVWLLLKIGIITAIPVFLINLQPDFGSSMVYLFIAGVFVLLSGIDWKIIATLVLGGGVALLGAMWIIVTFPQMSEQVLGLEPYQVQRVLTWFDSSEQSSDDTFHFDRSISALGSGQLTGKGIDGLQVSLPEAHTDFIFSVIGESFGFVGCALVVFLYFMLLYRMLVHGLTSYNYSVFGSFICFGFLSLIFIHAFQNVGMIVGIMPITGIPLLLLSYGGSSVLSSMIGLGLVYRVAVENSRQNDFLFK